MESVETVEILARWPRGAGEVVVSIARDSHGSRVSLTLYRENQRPIGYDVRAGEIPELVAALNRAHVTLTGYAPGADNGRPRRPARTRGAP